MEWMARGELHVADACLGGTAAHTLRNCMPCGLLRVLASLRETWRVGMFRGPWFEPQPWSGWHVVDCMWQMLVEGGPLHIPYVTACLAVFLA